jgi:putative hydrolase of the HAD superfamily
MKKKAVIFDLDDTLLWDERSIHEAFTLTCQQAFLNTGIDPLKLEVAVRREARKLYEGYETYAFTQMIGINPLEGLWGRFSTGNHPMFRKLESIVPQYRADAWTSGLQAVGVYNRKLGEQLGEQFAEFRRHLHYVYDDTYDVLNKIQGNAKLLLLTNGSPDLQKEKLMGVPRINSYFDHIVISGEFGRGKPDPSIFEYALSLLEITPNEGIMVGDKLTTDILGSSRIGMDNIWINHHDITVEEHTPPTYTVKQLSEILDLISL